MSMIEHDVNVTSSGRVAARRLHTLVMDDEDKSKKRNLNLLETALSMEKVIRSHQRVADDLRSEIESLTQQNENLVVENGTLATRVTELMSKGESLEEEVAQLKEEIQNLESENSDLKVTVADLTEVTNKAAEILEEAENERDSIYARLNSLVKEAEDSISEEAVLALGEAPDEDDYQEPENSVKDASA